MLSQEWAAIRTILHLPLMRNRKDPEIDTELTIELLCIVVAGNGAISISANFWALSVPYQVNARQFYLLPIPGTTFPESFQVVGMS